MRWRLHYRSSNTPPMQFCVKFVLGQRSWLLAVNFNLLLWPKKKVLGRYVIWKVSAYWTPLLDRNLITIPCASSARSSCCVVSYRPNAVSDGVTSNIPPTPPKSRIAHNFCRICLRENRKCHILSHFICLDLGYLVDYVKLQIAIL